ncbi:glutamate receptor ionotropic, kainate 2-like [Palaemon carinicauda]|uniref:glutamate receptor ionotropic, kainate 2-like n=1 Tax=Palaemon carinicauda TaxID=392227 RepID=UPI0035B5F6F0
MIFKWNLTTFLILGSFVSTSACNATASELECPSQRALESTEAISNDLLASGSGISVWEEETDERNASYLLSSTPIKSTYSQRESTNASVNEEIALARLLLAVAEREMKGCDLVVAIDETYASPTIVREVLKIPNPKQIVVKRLYREDSGKRGCTVKILVRRLHCEDTGKRGCTMKILVKEVALYFLVLPSEMDFQAFADSVKGKKTERLAAAIKFNRSTGTEWGIFLNQLFGSWEIKRAATWRKRAFTTQVRLYPDKLSDLKGVQLKCVTFEWKPSVFYYRSKNGTVLFRYGIDIGVVQTLSQVLNFTVQFEEPPNEEYWGREEKNGSWSGMMGKLARNEVDLGVVDLYVTIVRVNILDYTAPYDSELSCFMARTEPPLPRWQALAFPFQGTTWLAILVGLIVSGPVLFFLGWGSSKCGGEVTVLQTLSSSWYYALGIHCCETQAVLPINKSTRIFVIILWLYAMTLTIAYSTNLMAFLTVSKPPASMETIRELHASGIEVAGLGKFYGDALASASDPYLKSLANRFQDYNKDEVIFDKVLRGKSVMLQNSPYLEFVAATRFIDMGVPRLRLMKECFAPFNIAMALQRHSPLKRKFDQVIGWMINGGLIRHFFLNSLRLAASARKQAKEEEEKAAEGDFDGQDSSDGVTPRRRNNGVIPISLDHVQSIFFIYIVGCLSSLLFFLAEVGVHRRLQKRMEYSLSKWKA